MLRQVWEAWRQDCLITQGEKAGPSAWLSRAARGLVVLPVPIPCAACAPLAADTVHPRDTQCLPTFSPFHGHLGPVPE